MLTFLVLSAPRPGGGMAYAADLKSAVPYGACGFDPHPGHVIPNCYKSSQSRNQSPYFTSSLLPSFSALSGVLQHGLVLKYQRKMNRAVHRPDQSVPTLLGRKSGVRIRSRSISFA